MWGTGRGEVIGGNDMLIAAIARANGLTLVTHNCSGVGRLAGLDVEDWQAEPAPDPGAK